MKAKDAKVKITDVELGKLEKMVALGKALIKEHRVFFLVNDDHWICKRDGATAAGLLGDSLEDIVDEVYAFVLTGHKRPIYL